MTRAQTWLGIGLFLVAFWLVAAVAIAGLLS